MRTISMKHFCITEIVASKQYLGIAKDKEGSKCVYDNIILCTFHTMIQCFSYMFAYPFPEKT